MLRSAFFSSSVHASFTFELMVCFSGSSRCCGGKGERGNRGLWHVGSYMLAGSGWAPWLIRRVPIPQSRVAAYRGQN